MYSQTHSCTVTLPLIKSDIFVFRESINSLKRKYSQSTEHTQNDAAIDKLLNDVAKEGCQFLLDEVFLDLEVHTFMSYWWAVQFSMLSEMTVLFSGQHHLSELLTRKWLTGSHAVDTICVTVEDYFNDFAKIKKPYNQVCILKTCFEIYLL